MSEIPPDLVTAAAEASPMTFPTLKTRIAECLRTHHAQVDDPYRVNCKCGGHPDDGKNEPWGQWRAHVAAEIVAALDIREIGTYGSIAHPEIPVEKYDDNLRRPVYRFGES